MRYFLTLILMSLVIAGCSPSAHANANPPEKAANKPPAGNINIAIVATEGLIASATMQDATSASRPMVITVRPPMVPVAPIQGTPTFPLPPSSPPDDRQTFSNTKLGVAVDYPSDWIVAEQTDGAKFTSPQGAIVMLQVVQVDNVKNAGQCVTLINSHGLTADVCADAASFTYSAGFNVEAADGSTKRLILSTTTHEVLDVYRSMIDTLRPIQ